jgi:hypothetical protein
MTTSPSKQPIDLSLYRDIPLDDFTVLTNDSQNPMDVNTVIISNCYELEGLFTKGYDLTFQFRTHVWKPETMGEQGTFLVEIVFQPPHNRHCRYAFPFKIWRSSLMALALAPKVLFLAGPALVLKGIELPPMGPMTGVAASAEELNRQAQLSLDAHGGILVQLGEASQQLIRLLYSMNAIRDMVYSRPKCLISDN